MIFEHPVSILRNDGIYKGVRYFEEIYKPSRKPWFAGHQIERDLIVLISRLRSNHVSVNDSLLKIKVVDSAACDCGELTQTICHVLWDCPLHQEHRHQLLLELRKLKIQPPCDIITFIKKPNVQVMRIIDNFFKKCSKRL